MQSTREIKLELFRKDLKFYKTDFKCPGSGTLPHYFNVKQEGELWVAWCGHGPCPSYVANDGAVGTTPGEACQILEDLVSRDPDLPKL